MQRGGKKIEWIGKQLDKIVAHYEKKEYAYAERLGFGAGMALPNIKRNADIFTIDSETGRGTRLDIIIRTNGHAA